jgi:hypothetical protein
MSFFTFAIEDDFVIWQKNVIFTFFIDMLTDTVPISYVFYLVSILSVLQDNLDLGVLSG